MLRWVFAHQPGVEYEPVVMGVVSLGIAGVAMWFDRDEEDRRVPLLLVGLGIAPIAAIFSVGFTEVTPYAVPLALLTLVFGGAFRRSPGVDLWRVAACSVAATLAIAAHGAFVCLLPVVAIVIFQHRQVARALLVSAAGAVLVILAMWVALKGTGYTLVPGDSGGGGDQRMFAAGVLSPSRVISVLALSAAASPFVWLGSVLLLPTWINERRCELNTTAVVGALAHWGFIGLWGYDLGWPADADLKFVTAVLVWPLAYRIACDLPPRRFSLALVIAVGLALPILGGLTAVA